MASRSAARRPSWDNSRDPRRRRERVEHESSASGASARRSTARSRLAGSGRHAGEQARAAARTDTGAGDRDEDSTQARNERSGTRDYSGVRSAVAHACSTHQSMAVANLLASRRRDCGPAASPSGSPTGAGAGSDRRRCTFRPAPVNDPPPRFAVSPPFGAPTPIPCLCQVAPTLLAGDTRLLGVLSEADGKGTGAVPPRRWQCAPGGRRRVVVGRDATLVAVRPDGVTIRDRGRRRTLALRGQPAVTSSTPAQRRLRQAACAIPAGYKGPVVRLNAELVQGLIAQPSRCVRRWSRRGRARHPRGSGFSRCSACKKGDRVTQANGIALRVARRRDRRGSAAARGEPAGAARGFARQRAAGDGDPERRRLPAITARGKACRGAGIGSGAAA